MFIHTNTLDTGITMSIARSYRENGAIVSILSSWACYEDNMCKQLANSLDSIKRNYFYKYTLFSINTGIFSFLLKVQK